MTAKNLKLSLFTLTLTIASAALCVRNAQAADIRRANTSGGLANTGRWVGGVLPGPNDVAVWDNLLSTAANCTNNPSQDWSWRGIKILDPIAPPQIGAGSPVANIILGADGLNMGEPTSLKDFAVVCNVAFSNSSTLKINSGLTLTYSRGLDVVDDTVLTITGGGTIQGIGGNNSVMRVGYGTFGSSVVNQTAGTMRFNQSGTDVVLLHIGRNTGNRGTYNLSGGLLRADDNPAGSIRLANNIGGEGELNISGGRR